MDTQQYFSEMVPSEGIITKKNESNNLAAYRGLCGHQKRIITSIITYQVGKTESFFYIISYIPSRKINN